MPLQLDAVAIATFFAIYLRLRCSQVVGGPLAIDMIA